MGQKTMQQKWAFQVNHNRFWSLLHIQLPATWLFCDKIRYRKSVCLRQICLVLNNKLLLISLQVLKVLWLCCWTLNSMNTWEAKNSMQGCRSVNTCRNVFPMTMFTQNTEHSFISNPFSISGSFTSARWISQHERGIFCCSWNTHISSS